MLFIPFLFRREFERVIKQVWNLSYEGITKMERAYKNKFMLLNTGI